MCEWKQRQEIYHRLNPQHDDDLSNFDIEISESVVDDAVRYFTSTDIGWVYPAKSYCVAICYARWLCEEFGGDYLDYLNDPELLYNNDPYFVPYSVDSDTYDEILDQIGGWQFVEQGIVPDIKQYFAAEFFMDYK